MKNNLDWCQELIIWKQDKKTGEIYKAGISKAIRVKWGPKGVYIEPDLET